MVFVLVAGLVLARAPAADAQPATDAPPSAPPSADPAFDAAAVTEPALVEARAHHRRGLELYDEGDYRLALVEFERAHSLSHNDKILFNIGQVHYQLMSYAKARLALERYLALGGSQLAEKRRREVERDLATLRTRTATLSVRVNVASADVTINEASMGKAPLDAVVVDAGTLRVHVTSPGYAPHVREVTLAGGDVQSVTIDLVETRPELPRPDILVTTTTNGLPGSAVAGWVVTGILTAGTIGVGLAANAAASKYDTDRTTAIGGSPSDARAELERQRSLVSGLALTTDVLAVTTLIAGGISLYLSLRERPRPDAVRVRPAAAGAAIVLGF